ncbi:MAG TPA: Dabb family protein, partial [Vicinamibacteria bacterium]
TRRPSPGSACGFGTSSGLDCCSAVAPSPVCYHRSMIHHVVLIRLKKGLGERDGAKLLERARELLEPISVVRHLRLGRGLGKKAEVDFPYALIMDFDDETALEAYQVHPDHQRFVREVVDPVQDEKKVFDYRC